jgi:hypothetical protein
LARKIIVFDIKKSEFLMQRIAIKNQFHLPQLRKPDANVNGRFSLTLSFALENLYGAYTAGPLHQILHGYFVVAQEDTQ